MAKLSVGQEVPLLTVPLMTAVLLPQLKVFFRTDDPNEEEEYEPPVEAKEWDEAVKVVKARYPDAFIEPWEILHTEEGLFGYFMDFEGGGSDLAFITTNFYEDPTCVVHETLHQKRHTHVFDAGWIQWFCKPTT